MRPKSVKVGALTYSINWITNADWVMGDFPEDASGQTEGELLRIDLRLIEDIAEDTLRTYLIHEILHAVWWVTGLAFHAPRESEDADQDIEEHAIRVLSPTLLGVLNDNPIVLAYLLNLGNAEETQQAEGTEQPMP